VPVSSMDTTLHDMVNDVTILICPTIVMDMQIIRILFFIIISCNKPLFKVAL
jgi:hypothetical protein